MTYFIPIFPLQIVVFPTEKLNLHIFEPRYKQLINDCMSAKKTFGICTVINNQIQEFGTTIENIQIANTYDDGKLDIKTEATHCIRILEILKHIPNKLYMGAVVSQVETDNTVFTNKRNIVLAALRELHEKLGVHKKFANTDENLTAFDFAHYIGFSLQQEYSFLELPLENQRWEYIYRHIKLQIKNIDRLHFKPRNLSIIENVQRNGHFRDLK